ncbi:MAG: glycine zipper domain-containing protein [Bosea sp. (in: a-proteobacteria)]
MAVLMCAMLVGGCVSRPGESLGSVSGAVIGAAIGSGFGGGAGRVAATVAGAAIGGLIGGAIGRNLDDIERQRAYDAHVVAFNSGRRSSWRGEKGSYGFIEPAEPIQGVRGYCREYIHTIYIDGRPQRANGTACREADGSWVIIN